jgi:hypothetical protein
MVGWPRQGILPVNERVNTMIQHSPGKWYVSDGAVLSDTINQYGNFIVVDCQRERTPEDEANLQLIAAAPELLEACLKAFEQLERISAAPSTDQVQSHFDHESVHATDLLRAAMARAGL